MDMMRDPRDPRRITPSGELKQPKFVRFHYLDDAGLCDEIFWEDPRTFTPRRAPDGRVEHWGLFPYDASNGLLDINGPEIWNRGYMTQNFYRKTPSPEVQFVNCLIEKKLEQLTAMDVDEFKKRDYTLRIHVRGQPQKGGFDRIWRSVRVSAGLKLSVFSDKVLGPLFGLTRNLHAYMFHDYKDGALFGPKDSTAIDMMHLPQSGYAYISDKEWTIAHLVQEEGSSFGYQYDLGDNWYFQLVVEEIASAEKSTGAVMVLDGAGAHPPDGVAASRWSAMLRKFDKSPDRYRKEILELLYSATNYSNKPTAHDFDFDDFDLPATRQAVANALSSKASVPSVAKQFIVPFADGVSLRAEVAAHNKTLKKGQKIVTTPVLNEDGEPTGEYWEEAVNETRRDRLSNTACAQCGSPNDLKACSGCKQICYCSRSCQKAHWKSHKRECIM